MKRKLLYYDHFRKMPRNYNGCPIYHFGFKDVATGDNIILGQCYYNKGAGNYLGGHYYTDITEATEDFDILWNVSDDKISVVAETLAEVQKEYKRMLREGVSLYDINQRMMDYYQSKPKVKSK